MKTSITDQIKNICLAILLAFAVSRLPIWANLTGAAVGGALSAGTLWVLLTAYDEIRRQRRASMHSFRRRMAA